MYVSYNVWLSIYQLLHSVLIYCVTLIGANDIHLLWSVCVIPMIGLENDVLGIFYVYLPYGQPLSHPDLHTWKSAPLHKHSPDSKVPGANMGPTWVLSAPDGLHVGPRNFAIMVPIHKWHRPNHIRPHHLCSHCNCCRHCRVSVSRHGNPYRFCIGWHLVWSQDTSFLYNATKRKI